MNTKDLNKMTKNKLIKIEMDDSDNKLRKLLDEF